MAMSLTKREWLVIRMLGGGMTHKEIARSMSISKHTVHSYLRRAITKLRHNQMYYVVAFDLCLLIEAGRLEWDHDAA